MFLVIFILQVLILFVYYQIAKKYGITDKPNSRSSHSHITVRGGGVIFPLSILIWTLYANLDIWPATLSIMVGAVISFLDDRYTVNPVPRLLVHFIAIMILLYTANWTANYEIWILALALIVSVGWINIFNFMDGINGITTLYSLALILPLYYLQYEKGFTDIDQGLFIVLGLALFIFGFVNIRLKPLMFAGDVGSVSLALIFLYLILEVAWPILGISMFGLIVVYGMDAVLTIGERFHRKENILEAHRTHLYQYLANEKSIPHIYVSVMFFALQLGISFSIILITAECRNILMFSWMVLLALFYFPVKKWAKA